MAGNESIVAETVTPESAAKATARWALLDRWSDRCSDWLNPILVKEARQALKSRQFVITFSLLLVFAWGWSFLGIALLMPSVYYSSGGPYMLCGYFIILTIPLLIVIPFSAYRSLAGEREDGTFELLTITDLSARQIITGKLGSAALQILLYYSALAPCIAFTYLLRGLDVVSIVILLGYTLLASILLAAVGLLFATLARNRVLNVLLSVVLILGLALFTLIWIYWTLMAVYLFPMFGVSGFWVTTLAVVSFHVALLAMITLAAAGLISFASDNRSTRLRVMMMVQSTLWLGWMSYLWLTSGDYDVLYTMLFIAAFYWAIMGALMVGEYGHLSPRVRRTLPASFAGRMLRTWLNPGSGTGYIFCCLSFTAIAIAVCVLALIGPRGSRPRIDDALLAVAPITVAYVVLYVGLGRILILLLRARRVDAGLLVSVLLVVVLAVTGVLVPLLANAWVLRGFRDVEYSAMQAPNWTWTVAEWTDLGGTAPNDQMVTGALGIALCSVVVFLANLVLAYREVEKTRIATPARVLQDDQLLHPPRVTRAAPPTDPWAAEGEQTPPG